MPRLSFVLMLSFVFLGNKAYPFTTEIDVLHYDVKIEPDIQSRSIKGTVKIKLKATQATKTIALDAGDLQIDEVAGANLDAFRVLNHRLLIDVKEATDAIQAFSISYHGRPKRGLHFNLNLGQVHTVYFTDHWMICNQVPSDKATINLEILVPKGKQAVASGELVGQKLVAEKILYSWQQTYETPAYTYGFAMGEFNTFETQIGDIDLRYHSATLDEATLAKIFQETGSILRFFEEKSGIPYPQKSYSQVLIGSNFQEMSGLAVFSKTYAAAVLKDSSEIHLTGHELAHQWWGNRITCKDFSHFWLNEAIAVYMATAYHEKRFGVQKYLADIALYKKNI
ncbi:MAG: M1 family aminopeptidase [Bacteroidota bacterium]